MLGISSALRATRLPAPGVASEICLRTAASASSVMPRVISTTGRAYVLSVALSLLLGLIPGTDNPEQVRRYVRVFVLPTLLADPPQPEAVFI
ncbi:Probable transcriptional regulator%2C TetR family [Mycobacteroides abscessus]|nr:Probable transcriptional regulator%2C TetR family [Mycobacteroides abscessus]